MVLDSVVIVRDFYYDVKVVFQNAKNQLANKETGEGGNMVDVGVMQDTFQNHMSFKIKDFSKEFDGNNVNGCFTTGEAIKSYSKQYDWTGVLFLGFTSTNPASSNNSNIEPQMTLYLDGVTIDLKPNMLVLFRSRWSDLAQLSKFSSTTNSLFKPLFQTFFFNTYNMQFLGKDHYLMLDCLSGIYKLTSVLSEEKCKQYIDMSEKWVLENQGGNWDTKRHEFYPTTDIPVERLPYNEELREIVTRKVFPEIEKKFLFETNKLSLQDFFIIKYDANAQHKLDWHRDVSLISFNFCLNNDFEGGGKLFFLKLF